MTTSTETLLALALRVEQATGPDPALAAEIHCALRGYTIHEDTDPANGHFAFWQGEPWNSICHNCLSWTDPTSSLDAAMSLIPAGMILRRYVATRHVPHGCEVSTSWGHGGWIGESDHSFALALTAAALKARALAGRVE